MSGSRPVRALPALGRRARRRRPSDGRPGRSFDMRVNGGRRPQADGVLALGLAETGYSWQRDDGEIPAGVGPVSCG
ncbi:hypothetical protein Msi02_52880 [Microbispora siamensis]|uniref:Uncharacterized protein n=1 Tax=Microbispora siamensis TaxID=564413 RepID=A0ABQ4GST9_9ACTN|nr:hypothetical protein Msi02_52880 [Microbispora siamensis]